MRKLLNQIWHKVLVFLHLSPLSLAEKCRVTFGAAVILVLILALSIPYIWMRQLTRMASIEADKAKVKILLEQYLNSKELDKTAPAVVGRIPQAIDPNEYDIRWVYFDKDPEKQLAQLSSQQRDLIESLRTQDDVDERLFFTNEDGFTYSNYVRIFRGTDTQINGSNIQGSTVATSRNQPVAAVVVRHRAADVTETVILNIFWTLVAGLIAGSGAIIAFYWITQRVILRPVRQLRALANNVSEGNLDIRSSIRTRDEYEKLAEAFNHMLDGLQATQQRLRDANKQLDKKIAELSQRNIELFKANKVKSEFLANISHEFRTPLNSILGFAEIIREKPGVLNTEKNRKYAENITTAGKNLLNMINDLLDLAKTEAGKMKLHIETVSLAELCDAIVGSFSILTKNKKIKVKLSVDKDIPKLITDAGKVQQILYNFMSNAVKFTPKQGRIEVKASMLDDKTVHIAVSDTGCGIADADQKKIFEKFRQADGSITRKSAGTGLGLALSKELATLLAGNIGLESQLEKGSTFWLDIPVTISPEPGERPET